jgi:Rhodopirellula transposase DDE domain
MHWRTFLRGCCPKARLRAKPKLPRRSHPDRDAQFDHINQHVRAFQKRGQAVVSVDTKKKEGIGDFKNAGREWHPKGEPEKVRSKDFPDKALSKGIPYGVYDLARNGEDKRWFKTARSLSN